MKLSDTYTCTLYIAYRHHNYGVLILCYCVFCSISQLLSIPSAPHFRDLEVPSSIPAGDFCWMYTYTVYLTWSRSKKNDMLLKKSNMKIGYNFPELCNQGRELRGRVCNSSQTDQQSMVNWKNSINRMD